MNAIIMGLMIINENFLKYRTTSPFCFTIEKKPNTNIIIVTKVYNKQTLILFLI